MRPSGDENNENKDDSSEDSTDSSSSSDRDELSGEDIEDVLDEVESKVSEFISKNKKDEETFETSSESDIMEEPVEEINLETCSTRVYIEHTVGQILLTALTILERERPENPIKWLAEYLLFYKDEPSELIEKPFEQDWGSIKIPENIKKVIEGDLQDLDIEVVNKLL